MLFSCSQDLPDHNKIPSTGNDQIVHFSSTPITRTVFGTASGSTIPTLWTDNYCVAISMNYATAKKSTTPVVGPGGVTADFEASIDAGDATSFVFHAVSPYEAYVSSNSTYKSVQFTVPTAQTPSATSPDEKAQILFGQHDAGNTFPTNVTMNFQHLTAYGKISFSNLSLAAGETVASVSLTAAENWAGRYYYYVEDHDPNSAGDYQENSASKTITITTDQTSDIWFGCAPVDLGGKTIDVVVTTDKGTTYSKTITIPAGKKFSAGVVNAFTINMNGITAGGAVVYTLVKNVADLTLGSEIILVGKGDEVSLAMSTTQNNNNRGTASITKSTDASSNPIVNSPGADVQVLTIANGNKAGTYALSTGSGYLYAASSSSNWLRTEENLSNNSSWSIAIAADGEATMLAIGDNTRNYMRCNASNNPPIFSCYASTATTGVPVLIYKRNGTGSGAIATKVAESLAISGATTSYSVNDTYSFNGVVKLVYSDTSEETLSASDYTMDDSAVDMSKAGTYTIYFTYKTNTSIKGSYDITVTGGGSTPTTTTATFSYTDFTDQGTQGSGGSISATQSAITVASDKGYGTNAHVRVYSGGKITISSTAGNITKVEVTCTASGTSNNGPSKLSATGYSYSGTVGTWAGTAAKTVELSATAQVRFTQIVVTYATE